MLRPTGDSEEVLTEPDSDEKFAVLVDGRTGGLVLQHPLLDRMIEADGRLPERFATYRVTADVLPTGRGVTSRKTNYRDPLADDESGELYRKPWLAEMAPVLIRDEPSGLMVIVQETKQHAIGPTLQRLRASLLRIGLITLVAVTAVITLLWWFVTRALRKEATPQVVGLDGDGEPRQNVTLTATLPPRSTEGA